MEAHNGFRVNVKTESFVTEQLNKYKSVLVKLLEGQCQLNADDKNKLLLELSTNFEIAVQLNILVNGLLLDDSPEEKSEEIESKTLDDVLDEEIIHTTWKRSAYPKKILPYLVRSLKAERKLMNEYGNSIQSQELKRDPNQDIIINYVTAGAPTMFKQASTVMKSVKALKQIAESLIQVLNMEPSVKTLETYKALFCGFDSNIVAFCNTQSVNKNTVQKT